MGSEKLSRALRAAKFVGGEVDLSMDKNHLSVSVTVEAGEGVNVKFESGELSDLVCEAPTHSTYSLQYLGDLTKKLAGGLTEEVSMEFGEKYPLRLTWSSNQNHNDCPMTSLTHPTAHSSSDVAAICAL